MRPDAPEEIEGARPKGGAERYGILIVDDEQAILESLEFTLATEYDVFTSTSGEEALRILEENDIALVVADQVMPGMSGVEFLERVVERSPETIRIMLTGYADMSSLIRGINEGQIYRYIAKPWEPEQLRIDVKRGLETYELARRNAQLSTALGEANERLRAENRFLRQEAEGRYSFEGIIGESPAMRRVFDLTSKVAKTDATVLITGETGTGKDLIARAIHYSGRRRGNPFVAQNCGSLPDTLLESELFGHRKGAFTGADQDKQGLFESGDGGTIFLDEIGETESGMQVRLLRVLQDGEIRPLGSSSTRHVDVRVLAATNRDLQQWVEQGRFREDLFYRLRVVEIHLPPLRERREDLPALALHFLGRATEDEKGAPKGFTNGAIDRIIDYDWPGNVRELENEVERIIALSDGEELVSEAMLSERVRGDRRGSGTSEAGRGGAEPSTGLNDAVDSLKRRMILEAISEEGSKAGAAKRLGVPRQSLQKMMKRLEMGTDSPKE